MDGRRITEKNIILFLRVSEKPENQIYKNMVVLKIIKMQINHENYKHT